MPKQLTVSPKQLEALILEDEVETAIIDGFKALGYWIDHSSAKSFKPGANGKGYGATKGIADLFVSHVAYPTAVWCHLEVKRPVGGRLSNAQGLRYRDRRMYRVQSWEEALWAVAQFESEVCFWEGPATKEWRRIGSPVPAEGRCLPRG
ncbi:hypothetical protein EON79_07540 [bacterium]|nr:MAG: hypothetical protein EON79_07540 [bacterium]